MTKHSSPSADGQKRRRNIGIDVYLSPELTKQVAELAVKRGMTQSAVCRDLIIKAVGSDQEMQARIERIERLCAAAILSPAIATGQGAVDSHQNMERARSIINGALAGAANIIKRVHAPHDKPGDAQAPLAGERG